MDEKFQIGIVGADLDGADVYIAFNAGSMSNISAGSTADAALGKFIREHCSDVIELTSFQKAVSTGKA